MLEEPRLLFARALLPLYPPEPPPNAERLLPPLGILRLPTRSPPPPPDRLLALPAERLLTPAPPARLPAPPAERSLTPAPAARLPALPAERLLGRLPPSLDICCRALAWRLARESPRVVPPYLFAVA